MKEALTTASQYLRIVFENSPIAKEKLVKIPARIIPQKWKAMMIVAEASTVKVIGNRRNNEPSNSLSLK